MIKMAAWFVLVLVATAERSQDRVGFNLATENAPTGAPTAEQETWAEYFHSEQGFDMSLLYANRKALELLATEHPTLEDLKTWADYFASNRVYGDGMGYKKSVEKALEVLSMPHPTLADLKKGADYYSSSSGGSMGKRAAILKALHDLTPSAILKARHDLTP
mmetsp:Transcript_55456/g.129358  ORF Transcript_55456/g.129358 Transcript_55456/m.129358 type:complete len:162 (+) Transcript_55456:78-563(+)